MLFFNHTYIETALKHTLTPLTLLPQISPMNQTRTWMNPDSSKMTGDNLLLQPTPCHTPEKLSHLLIAFPR